MALVCQGVVSQLRNGGSATKFGILRRGGFRNCEMRWGGLRNGTRVPNGCFATAKIFAEGGMGLQNDFAAYGRFRKGPF